MNPSHDPATASHSSARAIDWRSPGRWLASGWSDLAANPLPGLVHGLLMALFGAVLFWSAREQFWLLAGAFSGFLLIAPILAIGLYDVSRALEAGQKVGLNHIVKIWRGGDRRLVLFGLLLALAGTGWVLTSAALITAWSAHPIHKPADFLRYVLLDPAHGLFEVWLLLGALLASPVFASSVVSIPMLLDTRSTVAAAVTTSWRVVADFPVPMALWAATIAILVGLGMATALVGLIVVIPLIAHASWHAYRDLVAEAHSGERS